MNVKLKTFQDMRTTPQNSENYENDTTQKHNLGYREGKKEDVEILMCFDSNGKHIDRKKLWKLNNSVYKRCPTIFSVSHLIKNEDIKDLKYILLSIGVNDLDDKDHTQVFGEMRTLINQIRLKYPGIKIIIGEATPRNDARDEEVKRYNRLLKDFASDNADTTVAMHENLRDPTWSMYYDAKHIHEQKIAKFAANFIRALKVAYNINNKSELFTTYNHRSISHALNSNHINSRFFTQGDRTNNTFQFSNQKEVDNNAYVKRNLETLANYDPKPSYLPENTTMKKLKK